MTPRKTNLVFAAIACALTCVASGCASEKYPNDAAQIAKLDEKEWTRIETGCKELALEHAAKPAKETAHLLKACAVATQVRYELRLKARITSIGYTLGVRL